MAKYIVTRRYVSSYGGPWEKGQELEMDPEEADRINVDSPGVLKPAPSKRAVKKSKDRQVKAASTRAN